MTGRPDPLESALRSAFDQGEPEGPECHLCGSTTGPWLPDPSGDRWPSGAQKLFCSRGCPTPTVVDDIAGKDIRDGHQPPADASTLSSDVLDLLTAIRDALTVPRAAPAGDFTETMERRRRRDELLADRATTVRIAAHVAVDLARLDPAATLGYLTQTIRDGIDAAPVDYEVRQDAGKPLCSCTAGRVQQATANGHVISLPCPTCTPSGGGR